MAALSTDGDPFFGSVRLSLLLDATVTELHAQRPDTVSPSAVSVVQVHMPLQRLDFRQRLSGLSCLRAAQRQRHEPLNLDED